MGLHSVSHILPSQFKPPVRRLRKLGFYLHEQLIITQIIIKPESRKLQIDDASNHFNFSV